jgi:hypothetical protein
LCTAVQMKSILKNNAVSIIICFVGFSLLAFRGFGYYTNDQTAFTVIADAFSKTGKIIAYPEDNSLPYFGNFHPPGLILLLGIYIKLFGLFLGPMLLQLTCLAVCLSTLLAVQRTLWSLSPPIAETNQAQMRKKEQHALCGLFFLVPFTHQSALLIDIDSSVLVTWGGIFLFAHFWLVKKNCSLLRTIVVMGAVFALGLWCKFTTPLFVFLSWALWITLTSPSRRRGIAAALATALVAGTAFLSTYVPFTLAQKLPMWECVNLAAHRFKGQLFTGSGFVRFFGDALRSMFYDMHWFSFLFFPMVIVLTALQFRDFSFSRQWIKLKLPLFSFWAVFIGYTFLLPTSQYYMPRYKYGLLPFVVLLMLKPFFEFISTLKKGTVVVLVMAAVTCVFVLPDFPTSSAHLKTWYHWFSLAPLQFQYYPHYHLRLIEQAAALSERWVWLVPVRAAMFVIYYLSIPIIVIFLVHCIAVAAAFFINHSIVRSMWLVILPLWASMFIMNMSREYQLFYDAGIQGFKETVNFLRAHLAPGERFLGYRDLVVYTGHQAFCLYRYNDGLRRLDTVRIDSLIHTNGLRYCAFQDADIYKADTAFRHYLTAYFDTSLKYRDYLVVRHRATP